MMKNKLYILLILTLTCINLTAQITTINNNILNDNTYKTILSGYNTKNLEQYQYKMLSNSLEIKQNKFTSFFTFLPLIIITANFDKDIRTQCLKSCNNKFIKNISHISSNYIGIYGTSALCAGLFIEGKISKNSKLTNTGLLCMKSIIGTSLTVYTIKLISGRQRPYYDNGQNKWHGFPNSLQQFYGEPPAKYNSFPSGHTAIAFSVATIISQRYHNTYLIPITSYSIATIIALSRLTEDKHYASDIITGSLIGYGIGKLLTKKIKVLN
ncbi:MAG TPA: phosphatase PAP2 family protein [Bacteroidales bacterium]|nr:phosphatase PAP2 family protein [Bacteroidales bacterium]